jgi:tetratricopeptide (TPR) repeat protein
MRRFFVSLVLLTSVDNLAFGQECDKAKLRGLIEYPKRSLAFKWDVSDDRDDSGDLIDLNKQIAEETKRLKGGVEDAEVYRNLADLYANSKDSAKETAARSSGIELLKPHLNTNDPRKYKLLVWYCELIGGLRPVPSEELIHCAHKAATIAPSGFDAWTLLGRTHEVRALSLVLDKDLSELRNDDTIDKATERIQDGLVRPTAIDKAETCLNEARRCYDRAKILAPDHPECRQNILAFVIDKRQWRIAFDQARGKPVEAFSPTPDIVEEARTVARLWPNKLIAQAHGFGFEFIQCAKAIPAKFNREFKELSAAEKVEYGKLFVCTKSYRERIEKIAQNAATVEGKIFCLNILMAAGLASEYPPTTAEAAARRILKLDPKSESAVVLLSQILIDSNRLNLAEDLTREQWAKFPSPKIADIHANCLAKNGHAENAEAVLRNGLHQWPDDFYCVLRLAALIMKNSEKAEALEEAGKLLERARNLIRIGDADQANLVKECDYYSAVHAALSGDLAIAHLRLIRLQGENPGDERFTNALSSFKR